MDEKKYAEEGKKSKEVIDKYFPEGDSRRGDAMIVAGISRMEGREEMRDTIIQHYEKKMGEKK